MGLCLLHHKWKCVKMSPHLFSILSIRSASLSSVSYFVAYLEVPVCHHCWVCVGEGTRTTIKINIILSTSRETSYCFHELAQWSISCLGDLYSHVIVFGLVILGKLMGVFTCNLLLAQLTLLLDSPMSSFCLCFSDWYNFPVFFSGKNTKLHMVVFKL